MTDAEIARDCLKARWPLLHATPHVLSKDEALVRAGREAVLKQVVERCLHIAKKTKHTSHVDGLGMGDRRTELAYEEVAEWAKAQLEGDEDEGGEDG